MMKEKYNIRAVKKNDIAVVVDIVRSSFNSDYLIPSIYRSKGIEQFIYNELENKFSPYKYFVIAVNKIIVGFAEFKIFENLSMTFLNIIAVSKEYANKGIGKTLLAHCRDHFLKKGFKSIQLDVYKSNVKALSWYRGLGFSQISSNSFYRIELPYGIRNSNNVYIQNYPQYKELQKILGFYFLDIVIGNENIKPGVIENDLFIRGTYNQTLHDQLARLSKAMKIKNVYLIGDSGKFKACKFIDEIVRLELNTEL